MLPFVCQREGFVFKATLSTEKLFCFIEVDDGSSTAIIIRKEDKGDYNEIELLSEYMGAPKADFNFKNLALMG